MPRGSVDRRHARRVLGRIGLLQLDSVNVCVRSHYMPLFSRLGPYRRNLIDEMAYTDRALFEYWGHEASLLPIDTFPWYRHRMNDVPLRHGLTTGYVEQIYRQVEADGPLAVGDIHNGGSRTGPWWGYGMGKRALEWLFAAGRVTCAHRSNFMRFYDVSERVIPAAVLSRPPLERSRAQRMMLLAAAGSHGVGTASDLADYYRIRMPEARPIVRELVEEGRLEKVTVEGWGEPGYMDPEARTPRRIERAAFLSPFDPVVWHRQRAERLFGFEYRIEIYVPAPKRVYGYYVYPFLLGDRLVGRADLKANRSGGRLEVKGVFSEPGTDARAVAAAMAGQLESMAQWLGLGAIELHTRGNLAPALRRLL